MQIEGRNPVLEALRAGTQLNKIFLEKGIKFDQKISEISKRAKKKKIRVEFVPKARLNKRSKTQVHQGVIATGLSTNTAALSTLIKDKQAFLIYIREALYEHNIGAIIRTAECIGATGIILPPKISISPQIRRASMGASEHISIVNNSLFQTIKQVHDAGIQIIGIERSENSTGLYKANLDKPILLIIGGEDRPLSKQILERCDQIVEIPMKGKVNSLNMSVAAAVVMYEVFRQHKN